MFLFQNPYAIFQQRSDMGLMSSYMRYKPDNQENYPNNEQNPEDWAC